MRKSGEKSRSGRFYAAAVLAVCIAASSAEASPNLVTNGDFEQFSSTTAAQVASPNDSLGSTLTGWTNAGYTFLFTPGSADTTGSYSSEYANTLNLWGPGANGGGVNNGLTATSPTGGNFIGVDGAYQQGALTQTISGLSVGTNYSLSFYWAAAQQQGYQGNTTESWTVALGNQTMTTPTISNPSEGFSPWRQQVFVFTATSATETLSFLANGTPTGTPPFSLLDGISLVAAPEPGAWALLIVGLAATMAVRRRRRTVTAAAPI